MNDSHESRQYVEGILTQNQKRGHCPQSTIQKTEMDACCMYEKKLVRKFKDIQTEGFTCERAPQALLQQVRFPTMGSNALVYDLGKYVHSEPFFQIPQSVSNHNKIPSEFGIS
jgi:hypothetical protein